MIAIQLPEDVEQRLDNLAQKTGLDKSRIAHEAIMTHLEDLEDYYLAVQAYEEHVQSGEKPISLDDVEKELGLDD